jgi:hypothetical protein
MVEFDCLEDAERAPGEIFTSVVLGYGMNWRYPKTSWSLLVTKRVGDGAYVRPNYRRQWYETIEWYETQTLKRVGVGSVEGDELLGGPDWPVILI